MTPHSSRSTIELSQWRGRSGLTVDAVFENLQERAFVSIDSTPELARKVQVKAQKIDEKNKKEGRDPQWRPAHLKTISREIHQGGIHLTPWDAIRILSRSSVLAGHGSSRALSQHWSSLRFLTALQKNYYGHMELSDDGRNPKFHRKSVQADDLGVAFGLQAALKVASDLHPGHQFTFVNAEAALEAGWTLRGRTTRERHRTRLHPSHFLIGVRKNEPLQMLAVNVKGSHTGLSTELNQLVKDSEVVHSVATGPREAPTTIPGLFTASALAGKSGIEVRALSPGGTSTTPFPLDLDRRGPVDEKHYMGGITEHVDGQAIPRPGFHIPLEDSDWFSRALVNTALASLLAFAGDLVSARNFLTKRQRKRLGDGAESSNYATSVRCDTTLCIGDIEFSGTDHVFRLHRKRIEVFSAIPTMLHERLAKGDVAGYFALLPGVQEQWDARRERAQRDWHGVLTMDNYGALMGLRRMGEGKRFDDDPETCQRSPA